MNKPQLRHAGARAVVVLLVGLLAVAAVVAVVTRPRPGANPTTQLAQTAPVPAASQPESQPATRRAGKPSKPAGPTTQYLDVVRSNYPRMPETRPLGVPLDLSQAARIRLKETVYLSPRGDLWITRADAPPTEAVLARAAKEQGDQLTLVVRDEVAFVHWTPRDNGPWSFTLIARGRDGGYDIVTPAGRTPLPSRRHYHWERALEWNDKVVVATDTGVSIVSLPEFKEAHVDLLDPAAAGGKSFSEPQFLMDWQGILAWAPWEQGKTGSVGAARYVDDKWNPLGPKEGWPGKLLHLVPLFDGTVLQLIADDNDLVHLGYASLQQLKVDEAAVKQLVDKLSDPDKDAREKAFKELSNFGPGAWPVLERLLPDAEPEAQVRLKQVLKNRVEPTMGGMTVLGDKLRLVARLSDGGAVFYAEVGMASAGEGEEPIIRSPAWVSIRPGQPIGLLDPPFTNDLDPDRSLIYAFGSDWVVTSNALGPQRFVGNGFTPLLRRSEAGFTEPVGVDPRGRWLFRKPGSNAGGPATMPATATAPTIAPTSTTAPATPSTGDADVTLILDPTLPDPTPRLPVWVYSTADNVGWDKDGWPAIKRGGTWALETDGWRAMRRAEKLFSRSEEAPVPKWVPPAPASTAASTGPATATAPADLGPPLLVDGEGTAYFDGRTVLIAIRRDGVRVDWPLPSAAAGSLAKAWLVRSADGVLFLYNQPGRILRIRPTPAEDEPFVVEATFTRNVPNADEVSRMWLDPGGRIVMAYGSKLAIMFPQGYVPPAISSKIPANELDGQD